MMPKEFLNKVVLISGASRGLGRELAVRFFDLGANLVLVARSMDLLRELKDQLLETAQKEQDILLISVDLSEKNAAEKIYREVLKHYNGVDVLVNNAAVQGPIGPVWENDRLAWERAMQVDLLSPVALCQSFVASMIEKKSGKIINLSGGGATNVRPYFSAYSVAKVGLVRFSETLAKEVESYGIDVNCIAPGVMQSQLLGEVLSAGARQAGEREYEIAQRPFNAESFKKAVRLTLYLASPQSNGVTGKLISAIWDPWETFQEYIDDLKNSDVYTLRRIIPKERGMDWGDVE